MSKGMMIFTIIMGWTLLIHGGLTYLIVKKKEYSLLSGFYNRPKDEQEYLINNGYIEKLGRVLLISFYLLLLAFLLTLLRVPYGPGIGFGLFTVFILAGIMYVQKFEVPHKRKKYMWIIGSISVGTFLFVGVLFYAGAVENEVTITEDAFKISGMYGVEYSIDEIEKVELLDELPEVLIRTNGMSTGNIQKGNFRLEEPYGRGKLYVYRGYTPYLHIAVEDSYIILNRKETGETERLYKELLNVWSR